MTAHRARTAAGLVFTAASAALIAFNYVVQTTCIPRLARERGAGFDAIIATFSMINPTSLAWGIEMRGWGLLGVATWPVAPVFRGSRLEHRARGVRGAPAAERVARAKIAGAVHCRNPCVARRTCWPANHAPQRARNLHTLRGMKAFKKILVPTDFSPHSREAIVVASDLSARYDASLTIVHVYEPVAYPLPEGFVLFTPQQLASMEIEFAKLLAAAKTEAEGAGARRVETERLLGHTPTEIVELAEKRAIDLIVMGTHGRTGMRHVVLGSVAERVVRQAPCPVMCVKAPKP